MVNCPEEIEEEVGSTFVCDTRVAGEFYEMEVTILDAQGRIQLDRRHAVLKTIATQDKLAADLSDALGFTVTAKCGVSDYLVKQVGDTFACTLTRRSTGARENLAVKVLDPNGDFKWQLP